MASNTMALSTLSFKFTSPRPASSSTRRSAHGHFTFLTTATFSSVRLSCVYVEYLIILMTAQAVLTPGMTVLMREVQILSMPRSCAASTQSSNSLKLVT